MPKIISILQGVLIQNSYIHDNILVTHEAP